MIIQYLDSIIIIVTVLAVIFLQWKRDRDKTLAENKVGSKLERDKLANEEIYPILWNALTEIQGARRVAITQFHNGGKFFSGNSINRMTMTHEVTRAKIEHVSKTLKDIIISRPFSVTIDELLEKQTAVYNDVNLLEDVDLKNYLKYTRAASFCAVLLLDSRNRPIGLIHVASDDKDVFTDPEIEGLKLAANNIANILERKS